MKRLKICALILSLCLAAGAMAACGGQTAEESTTAETTTTASETTTSETTTEETTTTTTIEETTTETEMLVVGEGASTVVVTNASGKEISELHLEAAEDGDFGEDVLGGDVVFENGQSINLQFDKEEEYAALVACDGDFYDLTVLPLSDMEECEIKFEDDIFFIEYTSLESGEEVSTEEAEIKAAEPEETTTTTAETTKATAADPDDGCVGDDDDFFW